MKQNIEKLKYNNQSSVAKMTYVGIKGADRVLTTNYWPDGSLKDKVLADGRPVGPYVYDLAGRLKSIGNQASASTGQPQYYIANITYNARGQTTWIDHGDWTSDQGFEYEAG